MRACTAGHRPATRLLQSCAARSGAGLHSGEWRNRQTRRLQVPVSFGMWGFKSPLAHSIDDVKMLVRALKWLVAGVRHGPVTTGTPDGALPASTIPSSSAAGSAPNGPSTRPLAAGPATPRTSFGKTGRRPAGPSGHHEHARWAAVNRWRHHELDRIDRQLADHWADAILAGVGQDDPLAYGLESQETPHRSRRRGTSTTLPPPPVTGPSAVTPPTTEPGVRSLEDGPHGRHRTRVRSGVPSTTRAFGMPRWRCQPCGSLMPRCRCRCGRRDRRADEAVTASSERLPPTANSVAWTRRRSSQSSDLQSSLRADEVLAAGVFVAAARRPRGPGDAHLVRRRVARPGGRGRHRCPQGPSLSTAAARRHQARALRERADCGGWAWATAPAPRRRCPRRPPG